jgi:hypothetical protein
MAKELKGSGLGRVLLDPIRLEQQTKYKTNGLTVTSNNVNIMPRDAAGNIIFHESSSKNPLLIIEPVDTKIMLKSVLKVLDTRFEYFKFPVTIASADIEDLTVDLTIPETEIPDIVYARYRPSENRRIPNGTPGSYSEASKFSGIFMDFVEDGIPQKVTNQYQITKEIKESGIDLRFRLKIEHRYDSDTPGFGNSYFSIIKNSPDIGLNRLFKGPFANQSILPNNYWGSIGQYEVQTLYIDIVIQNEEFEIGDYFGIGATADPETDSAYHTINAVQTYWVITDASKNVDDWNQEL